MEKSKELPKWIDNLKGKDPTIDSLIKYIEDSRQSAPVVSAPAVAVPVIGATSPFWNLAREWAHCAPGAPAMEAGQRLIDWVASNIAPQPAAAPVAVALVQGVPDGWKLVPRKMTDEQASEVVYNINRKYKGNPMSNYLARAAWEWAIYAAPQPPAYAAPVDATLIGSIKEGRFSNRFEWDSDEIATDGRLVGLNVYAAAQPSPAQADTDLPEGWKRTPDGLIPPAGYVAEAQGDALSREADTQCHICEQSLPGYQQGRAAGLEEACNWLVHHGGISGVTAEEAIRALNKTGAA